MASKKAARDFIRDIILNPEEHPFYKRFYGDKGPGSIYEVYQQLQNGRVREDADVAYEMEENSLNTKVFTIHLRGKGCVSIDERGCTSWSTPEPDVAARVWAHACKKIAARGGSGMK